MLGFVDSASHINLFSPKFKIGISIFIVLETCVNVAYYSAI